MTDLDLNRLNLRSSYSVWSMKKGVYGFKTDYNVLYKIEFIPDETIWEDGAYEFAIFNENSKISPNDPKVRQTIFAIIEKFFRLNPVVLLYQCETGDNRQAIRERLFLRWFGEYSNNDKYYLQVSEIIAEDIANYVALIVQRNNPDFDNIISTFNSFVGFFRDKPDGM